MTWSRYSESPAPCQSPYDQRVMPSVMRVTMPSRRLRNGMFDHTSPSTSYTWSSVVTVAWFLVGNHSSS